MAYKPAQTGRKNPNQKFYNSTAWRKLRAIKIAQTPCCEECERQGIITDATGRKGVIDHKTPINEGGEPLEMDNLETLCNKCHNRKSGREAHKKNKKDDKAD